MALERERRREDQIAFALRRYPCHRFTGNMDWGEGGSVACIVSRTLPSGRGRYLGTWVPRGIRKEGGGGGGSEGENVMWYLGTSNSGTEWDGAEAQILAKIPDHITAHRSRQMMQLSSIGTRASMMPNSNFDIQVYGCSHHRCPAYIAVVQLCYEHSKVQTTIGQHF